MAVVRDIEPWDALLQAGRDDERLVMQSAQNRRAARVTDLPAGAASGGRGRAARAGGRAAVVAPGRGAARRLGGSDGRHHGDRLGQVALLPAPDARHPVPRQPRPRALPLSGQGARPGPGARAARAGRRARPAGDLRRRHAARAAGPDPAARRTSCSPTPTCCTWGSCPTTRRGRTCSPTSPSSWSTRRTSTAACSARTWPTCCGGCGGSPPPTGPSRASSSPARRSPTRRSSPSA